jgi:hypothetical protein
MEGHSPFPFSINTKLRGENMEEIEEIEMEEAKELPLVEEGDFKAKVSKVQTGKEGMYGTMVVISFDIGGVNVPALASQNLNANTKLCAWAKLLTGKDIKIGETLRFQDLIGKTALVTVRNKQVKDKDGGFRTDENGRPVFTSVIKELRQAR